MTRLLSLPEAPRYRRVGSGSQLDPHKGMIAFLLDQDPKAPPSYGVVTHRFCLRLGWSSSSLHARSFASSWVLAPSLYPIGGMAYGPPNGSAVIVRSVPDGTTRWAGLEKFDGPTHIRLAESRSDRRPPGFAGHRFGPPAATHRMPGSAAISTSSWSIRQTIRYLPTRSRRPGG